MSGTKTTIRALLATAALCVGAARPEPARAASPGSTDEARIATWVAIQKMKAMDVMHLIDQEKKGFVTKEEFLQFQERLFQRMDRNHDGTVDAKEWMGKRAE